MHTPTPGKARRIAGPSTRRLRPAARDFRPTARATRENHLRRFDGPQRQGPATDCAARIAAAGFIAAADGPAGVTSGREAAPCRQPSTAVAASTIICSRSRPFHSSTASR